MKPSDAIVQRLKQHFECFVLSNGAEPHTSCFVSALDTSLVEDLRDDYFYEQAMRLLNNLDEQSKINSIKVHADRCRSLLNKLFTRSILNYYILAVHGKSAYEPFSPIQYKLNEHGKPSIEGHLGVQFSSSTSNEILCVVILVGKMALPLGVDLSHLYQPSISSTRFMDQFDPLFHPHERDLATRAGTSGYFAFNYLWTVKEAFTKLLGCGLNCDTRTFYPQLKDASNWLLAEGNPFMVVSRPSDALVKQLEVSWYTGASLVYDGFDPNKYPAISLDGRIRLQSTVLRPGSSTSLPVILTIVTQSNTVIQCAQVDFATIVRVAAE